MIKDAKKSQDSKGDLSCLAVHVCHDALPEDIHAQSGVPLPSDQKASLCPHLAWEDLQVNAHLGVNACLQRRALLVPTLFLRAVGSHNPGH